jgi:hypothetical protein
MIRERFGPSFSGDVDFKELGPARTVEDLGGYVPSIKDSLPPGKEGAERRKERTLLRVEGIGNDLSLLLSDGSERKLAGLRFGEPPGAMGYLRKRVVGKYISIDGTADDGSCVIHLKNRIFVNGELVRAGLAAVDKEYDGPSSARLRRIAERAKEA